VDHAREVDADLGIDGPIAGEQYTAANIGGATTSS
jgi:hypothetical protein